MKLQELVQRKNSLSKKYASQGTIQPYEEDFHFYRDLNPTYIAGGDPIDADNRPLNKGDVPGVD